MLSFKNIGILFFSCIDRVQTVYCIRFGTWYDAVFILIHVWWFGKPLPILWDPLRSFEILWDPLRSFEILWDPLSLSVVFKNAGNWSNLLIQPWKKLKAFFGSVTVVVQKLDSSFNVMFDGQYQTWTFANHNHLGLQIGSLTRVVDQTTIAASIFGGINTENKMEIHKWIPQCIKQTNSSNFCLFFFIGLVYVW